MVSPTVVIQTLKILHGNRLKQFTDLKQHAIPSTIKSTVQQHLAQDVPHPSECNTYALHVTYLRSLTGCLGCKTAEVRSSSCTQINIISLWFAPASRAVMAVTQPR